MYDRSPEFRSVLLLDGDLPAIEFYPPEALELGGAWQEIKQLWLKLPPHPHVLHALRAEKDDSLSIAYAALDHGPVEDQPGDQDAALWGAQLCAAFEHVARHVPARELGWLSCPTVEIDLQRCVRVGFLPTWVKDDLTSGYLSADHRVKWPGCDEGLLAHVVAQIVCVLRWGPASLALMQERLDHRQASYPIARHLRRALDGDARLRYGALAELRSDLLAAVQLDKWTRTPAEQAFWDVLEQGLGFLEAGRPDAALARINRVLPEAPDSRLVERARKLALAVQSGNVARVDLSGLATQRLSTAAEPTWVEIEARGLEHEADGRHAEALTIYAANVDNLLRVGAMHAAMGRCCLALGQLAAAAAHAGRALREDADDCDALAVLASVHLREDAPTAALPLLDRLVQLAPDDGDVHHARGRCLVALGRLVEARSSFDRAQQHRPQLVEALLLRREVDRSLARLRKSLGPSSPASATSSDPLADILAQIAEGQVHDALRGLASERYANDAAAQLLRGNCLQFDHHHAEAVEAYQRAEQLGGGPAHAARLGRARALVELGRADEALALIQASLAEKPLDPDGAEELAFTLERLGRPEEAARAHRRFLSLAARRASLRERTARPWR